MYPSGREAFTKKCQWVCLGSKPAPGVRALNVALHGIDSAALKCAHNVTSQAIYCKGSACTHFAFACEWRVRSALGGEKTTRNALFPDKCLFLSTDTNATLPLAVLNGVVQLLQEGPGEQHTLCEEAGAENSGTDVTYFLPQHISIQNANTDTSVCVCGKGKTAGLGWRA